jgi:hypothetical protein
MQVNLVDSRPGVRIHSEAWEISPSKLPLRTLIRERVFREVEAFNRHRPEVYHGLIQPEEAERLLNGYRVKQLRELDPEREFQRACRAFAANGLLVIAGGRQVESLDEEIDLATAGEVEFLQLVALAGGSR